jgi:AcrR family transcriptional regulator
VSTKSSRTRDFILTTTAPMFNMRGYDGTSLLDLTTLTGLTKGALYGNFENKQGIARAVFKYSMEVVRAVCSKIMEDEISCKGKLTRLFEFYGAYVFHSPIAGGCPMINNAVQADDYQLFLKKDVKSEIRRTVKMIARLLEKGRSGGEFKADIQAEELAEIFFCAIEGAIVMSRVSSSDKPMRAVLKHCNNILQQISL